MVFQNIQKVIVFCLRSNFRCNYWMWMFVFIVELYLSFCLYVQHCVIILSLVPAYCSCKLFFYINAFHYFFFFQTEILPWFKFTNFVGTFIYNQILLFNKIKRAVIPSAWLNFFFFFCFPVLETKAFLSPCRFFWVTWKMWVYAMVSVRPASWLADCLHVAKTLTLWFSWILSFV